MATHTAVAIDDDFAASKASVALRSTDYETAGGVNEVNGLFIEHLGGENFLDDFLDDKIANLAVLHVSAVLGGNDDVGDADRLAILVLNGDLALGVGTKPLDAASFAQAGQLAPKTMRKHDWSRHQLRCFVASEPEHQSLIPGPLLRMILSFGGPGINSLRDIGTLRGNHVGDKNSVGVENVIVVDVADFADRLADDRVMIEFGFSGDFAADDNHITLRVGFAGDAAAGILSKTGVQDGVRDGIANFVRVAFADRLGGKDVVFAHKQGRD